MTYESGWGIRGSPRRWSIGIWTVPLVMMAALFQACSDDDSVRPPPQPVLATISVSPESVSLHVGEKATFTAQGKSADGTVLQRSWTWTSSNIEIATVSASGEVTGVALGTATVTAAAEGKTGQARIFVQPFGVAIGAAGGLVVSADGNAELEIPPGALTVMTDVVIEPVTMAAFLGDSPYIPGTAYQVKPDGLQLQTRAHLRIRFDPNLLPGGALQEQLRLRELEQNQWRETEHHQLLTGRVEGELDRFGVFAVVVQPLTGTMIGPEGGTVTSADGNVVLEIPAGAISVPTEVIIEPVDDSAFLGDPQFVKESAYEIKPAGLQLNAPAKLGMKYDPNNMPTGTYQDQLRIRERDRVQNRWRDPSQCSQVPNAVQTQIQNFGLFAIIASGQHVSVPSSITVSPAVLMLEEGDVVQMDAVVRDSDGTVIDADVTWTSSNTAIAVVDATGKVTAVAKGTVVITASIGSLQGSASAQVDRRAASVTVVPAQASVAIGGTVQLTAEVRDASGNLLTRTVSWQSSSTSIATVHSGLVTGVAAGSAQITARTQSLSGSATVTVSPPAARVEITNTGNEPVEIGATKQLTAIAYDASGQPVTANILWTSSDANILTVDQTGLVTGVSRGTATVKAAVGSASDQIDINVVGETTETTGNNLSLPLVFADGVGITGQALSVETGLRPFAAENIIADTLPFWWSGNLPTYNTYYEQQTPSVWVAEWIDGTGQPAYDAQIYWGDNLTVKEWSASRPIRVEQSLTALALSMRGFNMTWLYGEGIDEMYGTDGSTALFAPQIYTAGAQLTVEKLDGPSGRVVATVVSVAAGSEVNVAGKVIYGYLLRLEDWTPPTGVTRDGWYRLTFQLASGANVKITSVGNTEGTYLPTFSSGSSSLEILVNP